MINIKKSTFIFCLTVSTQANLLALS